MSPKEEILKGTPLVRACEKGSVEDVEGIIQKARAAGMDVTKMVNEFGINSGGSKMRPLMAAAMNEHTKIIEILLQNNVNTAAFDDDGWNALHWAARYNKTDTNTVQLLLEHMKLEDINRINYSGETPLELCDYNKNPIRTELADLIRGKGGLTEEEIRGGWGDVEDSDDEDGDNWVNYYKLKL